MTVPVCVCGRPLPELAIAYSDPWCSTECARAAHGCSLPVLKNPTVTKKACDECGGGLDEETDGCQKCRRRHATRRLRKGTEA